MLSGHASPSVYSPNASATLMNAAEEAAQRATLDALVAAIRQQRQIIQSMLDRNLENDVLARVG